MNTLPQSQQDFFLYVPGMPAAAVSVPAGNDEDAQCLETGLPVHHKPWIKIPLADSLVVYAHLWDERDRAGGYH